jgi:hypothetical protein
MRDHNQPPTRLTDVTFQCAQERPTAPHFIPREKAIKFHTFSLDSLHRRCILGPVETGATDMTTETKGTFRIRQVAAMFVIEELRHGSWHIIESVYHHWQAEEAAKEYRADGHTVIER